MGRDLTAAGFPGQTNFQFSESFCIQTGILVLYYTEFHLGPLGGFVEAAASFRLFCGFFREFSRDSAKFCIFPARGGSSLSGQIDRQLSYCGFWRDVTKPLPAKRGWADGGRLFFACAFSAVSAAATL